MSEKIITELKTKITERHGGDEKQLEVIFSESPRILVEAPAGYGKTNTMVSKIAFMLAKGDVPFPKKMLALTFSVNAAYKIKKDVAIEVPKLLNQANFNINDKLFVSNYHGFCRSILKKYGYKIHTSLKDFDKLDSIDDNKVTSLMRDFPSITQAKAEILVNFTDALKNLQYKYIQENINKYNKVIVDDILPNGAISYNGILTLTIHLFTAFPKIKDFYTKYYVALLIDEFQDTNFLSYWLVYLLIIPDTKVVFLGDTLQRIYGFIGAVPNLLKTSATKFGLEIIPLNKNYRFASNPQMLLLDSNIRRNAENPTSPTILETVIVDFTYCDNQKYEAIHIIEKSISILEENPNNKIAILVKQRGNNINSIIESMDVVGLPYFNAFFTDEDVSYVKFHRACLFVFIDLIKSNDRVDKKFSVKHLKQMSDLYPDKTIGFLSSYFTLLNIFWDRFFIDFASLDYDEKLMLIRDTFEHNSLKLYIEFVGTNIVLCTVHGAKGLEWDYVLLPDIEQDQFPNYRGLCDTCRCKSDCTLIVTAENLQRFLDELSVFYVAVTRARKHVYFSASKMQIDNGGNPRAKNISCFLKLKGIAFGTPP